jgi:hypothetical protein
LTAVPFLARGLSRLTKLRQVYGAITFCLAHRNDIERYLETRRQDFEATREASRKRPSRRRPQHHSPALHKGTVRRGQLFKCACPDASVGLPLHVTAEHNRTGAHEGDADLHQNRSCLCAAVTLPAHTLTWLS